MVAASPEEGFCEDSSITHTLTYTHVLTRTHTCTHSHTVTHCVSISPGPAAALGLSAPSPPAARELGDARLSTCCRTFLGSQPCSF